MRILPGLLASLLALPGAGAGQEPWNSDRVLELVGRARALRQGTVAEEGLRSYSADARGYVYFFLQREGSGDPTLVKTDQIALQIFWQAPRSTQQIIVGQRDANQLPTNIRYHLDHLTVVQDDFGDRIRIGDGDEVSAVPHPLAPGSEDVYDFGLGDSLTVRFGGLREPIRVFEVRVRPRDPERPGFVGSVFLDRSTAAVVRMRFTFTPASYVDPHLDYIRVSLDNALWEARYWLPHRQEVEIRRESPIFDLSVGSVIRGRFEISGYEMNEVLPAGLFLGPRVTALSEAARRDFEFDRGLFDDIEAEGLGPAPELDEIRDRAAELARQRLLSGLGPVRLYSPNVSAVARRNRAEGTTLGVGLSARARSGFRARALVAYAFGREQGQLEVTLDRSEQWPGSEVVAFLNRPRDIGPVQAASGLVNSISVVGGSDFQDLYFSSGARARQRVEVGDWTYTLGARWERQRSATDVLGGSGSTTYRPVLGAVDGDQWAVDAGVSWTGLPEVRAEGALTLGWLDGDAFTRGVASVAWTRRWVERRAEVAVRVQGGATSSDAPAQNLFLLGGRGTLPGYGFRAFAGHLFLLARSEAGMSVLWPWIGVRAFAAIGATGLSGAPLPPGWSLALGSVPRTSAGVAFDLLWDVVRLEVGRGLARDGDWEMNLFASTRFWPFL